MPATMDIAYFDVSSFKQLPILLHLGSILFRALISKVTREILPLLPKDQ
jgi:hypothetical protein